MPMLLSTGCTLSDGFSTDTKYMTLRYCFRKFYIRILLRLVSAFDYSHNPVLMYTYWLESSLLYKEKKKQKKETLTPEIDSENWILSDYSNYVYLKIAQYLHTTYKVASLPMLGLFCNSKSQSSRREQFPRQIQCFLISASSALLTL